MDPFSVLGVTASIIACIQLTCSLLQRAGPSDHNRADLNRILQVVTGFRGAFEGLKLCLQFNENDHARLSTLQHLEGPLKDSKAILEFLQKRLENLGFMNQFILGKTWDGKLKKLLERLEDAKALFELAMHSDQQIILTAVESYIRNAAEDIRDIKDMVNDSNSRLVLLEKSARESHEETKELHSQTAENISRITTQIQKDSADHGRQVKNKTKQEFINWLSNVDPTTDHNTAYAKHQPETGMWLIEGQEYIEWRERPGSFLWLNGIPGCGKTILCATIIEDLRSYCSTDPSRSVAFFYFSFNDTRKQQTYNLLCSTIAQLTAQSRYFSKDMQKLYQNHHFGQPPLDALKITLRSILEQHGDKYIIIDALDECPSQEGKRGQLCALLQEISNWDLPLLHILTTSRREPDIEKAFAQIPNISHVPIENARVHADIRQYVEAQLVKIPKFAKWPVQLREEITESLVEGADGMFRWAYCQIDALQKCVNQNAVRKALKMLPKSLDDTYDRMLLSIDPDFHEYASTALKWLVFAKRPLFLSELAEAAVIQPGAASPFDIENRFQSADDILHILSSLVIIQVKGTLSYGDDFYAAGYGDETSPIVRLAHFLCKGVFDLRPNFEGTCGNIQYACTGSESFDEDDLDDFPLLSYSCEYWPSLARSQLQPSTADLLSNCLSTKRWLAGWMTAMNTWYETFEEFVDHDGDYWPASFEELLEDDKAVLNVALYIVAYFGLRPMLQPLIRLGADPNWSIKVADEFPIIAATSKGEYQIVQDLIQMGADITLANLDGETALHEAVSQGNSKIAHLLLENGFDVNMGAPGPKNLGKTPLITAICKGSPSMIQMLLEKGAVVDFLAVGKLLVSRSGLDEESELLVRELSQVSDQNREKLLELLLRVNKILKKRPDDMYAMMTSGSGLAVSLDGAVVLHGSDS